MGIAMRSTLPAIFKALNRVKEHFAALNNGVPSDVTVTGHSLGAGMALLFSSAVTLGRRYNARFSGGLLDNAGWKAALDRLGIFPISAPAVGSAAWVRAMETRNRAAIVGNPLRNWNCAAPGGPDCTPAFSDNAIAPDAARAITMRPTIVRIASDCDPITFTVTGSAGGGLSIVGVFAARVAMTFSSPVGIVNQHLYKKHVEESNTLRHAGYEILVDMERSRLCASFETHEPEYVRQMIVEKVGQNMAMDQAIRGYTSLISAKWATDNKARTLASAYSWPLEPNAPIGKPRMENLRDPALFAPYLANNAQRGNNLAAKVREALHLAAADPLPPMPALPDSFAANNERVREMLSPGYISCGGGRNVPNCVSDDDASRDMLANHRLPNTWIKAPFNLPNEAGWNERDFYFECNALARETVLHWYKGTENKGFGTVITTEPFVAAIPCAQQGMEWPTARIGTWRTATTTLSTCIILRQEHGTKTSLLNLGNGVLALLAQDGNNYLDSAAATARFNSLFRRFHTECLARSGRDPEQQ